MQFESYDDLLHHIFALEAIKDYRLEKVKRGAELLNNPQNAYKILHITGTNGKGSVANMCFSVLSEAHKKTGIFTSPHLLDIRERFKTTNGMISQEDFLRIANTILSLGIHFSYFEICTLMAFVYFQEQACEYAIIEVGIGGRLDSTNIVEPFLTCITSIGYDHQQILGSTLEEIAFQKAGIIKSGIPLVINEHNLVIEDIAKEQGALLLFASGEQATNLLGVHQRRNAALAHELMRYVDIDEETIARGLQHVQHRGRAEYLSENILIDGAHNEQGIQTLLALLDQEKKNFSHVVYCFSLKKEKKADLVVRLVGTDKEYIVVDCKKAMLEESETLLADMQGLQVQCLAPNQILALAQANKDVLYVVFGSLYMIGEFYS